ncbi:hypothetical protein F4825DRAFT_455566 [Nemania diffusa]|nr:hypothetical protein F4825DRAFT_455566 [Nemania diffusa]
MSKWECIVDHFKDSKVAENERAPKRPKLEEQESSAMSNMVEEFLTASGKLRALSPDDDPEADGFIENLVKQAAQGFEKAARGVMQRARAKARAMAAKPGKEEERRGGREESQVVGSIIE